MVAVPVKNTALTFAAYVPASQVIGIVFLSGDRTLDIALIGSRDLDVPLPGECVINVPLRGEL